MEEFKRPHTVDISISKCGVTYSYTAHTSDDDQFLAALEDLANKVEEFFQ